jgi:hypothetical protein
MDSTSSPTRKKGDSTSFPTRKFAGIAAATLGGLVITVTILSSLEWTLKSLATAYHVLPKTIIVVLSILGVCIALLVLQAPIYRYVMVTQLLRRRLIRSYYSPQTITEYLQQFWSERDNVRELLAGWEPGNPPPEKSAQDIVREFDEILDEYFGLAQFAFPFVLLTLVGLIVLFFAIEGGLTFARSPAAQPPAGNIDMALFVVGIRIDLISIAAIFGAYTWITSDAIARNYQGTLNSSHLYWYALRLIIAIPLGGCPRKPQMSSR